MTYAMGRPLGPSWAPPSVAVFGAGVAGMTVAHELAERGFTVDLYEAGERVGGKAGTQYTSFVDTGGTTQVAAAEHGFRLFPAFYRHVIDTMSRIPFDRETPAFTATPDVIPPVGSPLPPAPPRRYTTVADGLIATTEAAMALRGFELRDVPRAGAGTIDGFLGFVEGWFGTSAISPDIWTRDLARFELKLLQFLTSCEERREKLDAVSWLDYVSGGAANTFSPAFQRMVKSFIRTMVAMDATHGSAYTVGRIAMQMLLDVVGDGATTDRVLDGPTSQQWLTPWMDHLRRLGVTLHGGSPLQSVTVSGGKIVNASIGGLVPVNVVADYYVLALPATAVRGILQAAGVTPASAPSLAWLVGGPPIDRAFAWLSGAQFYLRSDVPMVRGHVYFPDAPWGLSSVAQGQFWGGGFGEDYGDREFHGILSVDVADWDTPGQFDAAGVAARDAATSDVIALEIWHQMADALSSSAQARLEDGDLYGWHLDDSIVTPDRGSTPTANLAPHFIHPVGSRLLRPRASTEIANLMLAADYVRTETDLASMEGACEAGRLAANAILAAAAAPCAPCATFQLTEPHVVDGLKALDQRLVAHGDPHAFDILGLDAAVAAAPSISLGALRAIAGSQNLGELAANLLAAIPTLTF